MSFDFKEFENYISNLEKWEKEVKKDNGVPFNKLFNRDFMKRYTRFMTIDKMFENSGFKINSQEDFENIPDDEWDNFIKNNTSFKNWNQMINKASEVYFNRKMEGK